MEFKKAIDKIEALLWAHKSVEGDEETEKALQILLTFVKNVGIVFNVDLKKDKSIKAIMDAWDDGVYWGGQDDEFGGYEPGHADEDDCYKLIQRVLDELKGRLCKPQN